jgi:hypothetical protein
VHSYPPLLFLFHFWKSLIHPSRPLQRGSGWTNLAIHVSAPWGPRPPLCTVIEETWRTFFTHARDMRSNSVNNRDARIQGPLDVWSCQCQVISAKDRGIARRSQASSLMSSPAEQFSFGRRDKRDFWPSCFRGMYF